MLLTVTERLVVLPAEGDFTTVKTIRQTREALAFDDDIADGRMVKEGEGASLTIKWTSDYVTEIDLSKASERLLGDALKVLDKQKKLNESHLPLCEKFLEET